MNQLFSDSKKLSKLWEKLGLEDFLELWQSKSAQYDSALENKWRTLEDKINITLSKAIIITEPNPDHLLNDRLKALEINLEKLIRAPNESANADSKSQQTETRVESAPKSLFISAVVKQSEQPSRYFKHKFQFLNFNTNNMPLHLSKCSTWNAKKIYEYTQYFSSYERKLMPPFVVLNI